VLNQKSGDPEADHQAIAFGRAAICGDIKG
jgi:hypothetical protein